MYIYSVSNGCLIFLSCTSAMNYAKCTIFIIPHNNCDPTECVKGQGTTKWDRFLRAT